MGKTKFGAGLIFGALLGGVAAFFLSPTSGKENRERAKQKLAEWKKKYEGKKPDDIAKELFGTAHVEGKKLYLKAQSELNAKLEEVKKRTELVDRDKYQEVVDEVISHMRKEKDVVQTHVDKLKEYLTDRWEYIAQEAEEDIKTVIKGEKETEKKGTKKS